jgi:hypothetical protein
MHLTKLEQALSTDHGYNPSIFELMKEMVPEATISPPLQDVELLS